MLILRQEDPRPGLVYSASFSVDGSRGVTASEDKTARVWDAMPVSIVEGVGTAPPPGWQ